MPKKKQRFIASHRISVLFNAAEEKAIEGKLHLAHRYVDLARKISMRNLTPIPKEYKRKFCKHCYHFLLPTKNCRVRIQHGKIITYCYHCGKYQRIPISRV
jgi:ribonuclease P protein subunit RPR2